MTGSNITQQLGLGWNLGNSLDAYDREGAHETAWGNPPVTRALIKAVRNAGFSTLRIPVTYLGRIGAAPDFRIDPDWLSRIREITEWALDEGLYVILNIHHDGNCDKRAGAWIDITAADQTSVQAKFRTVWQQIADCFADYDERLILESMNEIHDGSYQDPRGEQAQLWFDRINALNQVFVDTVRASGGHNADRFLLLPGFNTNIKLTLQGFVLPHDTVPDKLMLSVHYYDPYDFALNENGGTAMWGNDSEGNCGWGNEDYIDRRFGQLKEAYCDKGLPVVLGEFGAINKQNETQRASYLGYITGSAHAHGIVPLYWDNGFEGRNGFALFDRHTAQLLHPALLEAMKRGIAHDGI